MKSKSFLWVIPFVISIVLYWRTLGFESLSLDEGTFIGTVVPAYRHIWEPFFLTKLEWTGHYYRPLFLASLIFDLRLFHGNIMGCHAVSIFIHAVNALLVYLTIVKLLSYRPYAVWAALAGSVMFAVHPAQTEVVCWVPGRTEELAMLFTLASFVSYLYFRDVPERLVWLYLSLFSFFLAILAKETSLVLPFLIVVYELLFPRKAGLLRFRPLVLYLFVVIAYFIMRQNCIGSGGLPFNNKMDLFSQFLTVVKAYGYYIQKIIFPVNLEVFVENIPRSLSFTIGTLLSFFTLLGAGLFSIYEGKRMVFFHLVFFMVALLPAALVPLAAVSVYPLAVRYLYIPSYAASFLVGSLMINKIQPKLEVFKWIFFVIIIAVMIFKTNSQINVWQNDITLWKAINIEYPEQITPYIQIGAAYQKKGDIEEAVRYYNKGLQVKYYTKEIRSLIYSNLGTIYFQQGKYDEAEEAFNSSLMEAPQALAYYNLGRLYYERAIKDMAGKRELFEKARQFLEEAKRLNPNDADTNKLLQNIRDELSKDTRN